MVRDDKDNNKKEEAVEGQDYHVINGVIIPADESNNPEKDHEIKKLKAELRAVREVIAYKGDNKEFLENQFRDKAIRDRLEMEYYHYLNQEMEQLYIREERLVRDLATLNVDASLSGERPREEFVSEEMNETATLEELMDEVEEELEKQERQNRDDEDGDTL